MRTSRVARETSKYFDTAATATLPRRSTRSTAAARANLARFSYKEEEGSQEDDKEDNDDDDNNDLTFGSDIEDAVKSRRSTQSPSPSVNGSVKTISRKRKRTTTTTTTTTVATTATTTTTRTRSAVKSEVSSIKSEVKSEQGHHNVVKTEPETSAASASKPRAPRKQAARIKKDPATGEVTSAEPPTNWEEIYNLVKEMRLHGPAANAAVDTMGCERLATPGASARDRRFHTLVALMLSSQTKDTVNAEAMARLKSELPPYREGAPPGLNLENMLAVDPVLLNELIWKVGFHNNKTK